MLCLPPQPIFSNNKPVFLNTELTFNKNMSGKTVFTARRYYEMRSMNGRYASYWNAFCDLPHKIPWLSGKILEFPDWESFSHLFQVSSANETLTNVVKQREKFVCICCELPPKDEDDLIFDDVRSKICLPQK